MTWGVAEPNRRAEQNSSMLKRGLDLRASGLLESPWQSSERTCWCRIEVAAALFHLLPVAKASGIQKVQDEIGDFRKRRHDHDDLMALLCLMLHDRGGLTNPFGTADRCAAKFHNNQTHGNLGQDGDS